MTNKTILHISKYYYPAEGGIETVAKYLAEGLTDFKNIVICFASDKNNKEEEINGIKVYRVAPFMRISSQDICFGYGYVLKEINNKYHPNIALIHCPNPFVYYLANKELPKTCKKILLWHSDILSKGLLYKVIKPIENLALRKSDLILATSPNYIHPSSPTFKYRDKIKVLPNGVITKNLIPKEDDEKHIKEIKKKYAPSKLILFVGRHIPYKGIDNLIASEQYIKSDVRILIAGQGSETKKLKELAQNQKRITFLGKVNNDELRWLYYASDIFAFPSITKQEAFGVAMAEAMFCGCIPVTFHLEGSGVNWVNLKGVTGEEVPLKDIKAFANAIDKILGDSELKEKYSLACKKRINEKFTDKVSINIAKQIFNSL